MMLLYARYLSLTSCLLVANVHGSHEILDQLYLSYNKNIRPPGPSVNETATQVHVSIYVLSLSAISELTMDFTVNMYIRQIWTDHRLSHNLTEDVQFTNKLDDTWLPDLFIRNDKVSKISDVTVLNKFARVSSDGSILYSQRVTSTISCPMDLAQYPFDVQCCKINLESYGQTTQNLILEWKSDGAVELDSEIQLPEHLLRAHYQSTCSGSYNSTGEYSCLLVQFEFARNVEYYIMSLFVPSVLIVVLSWVAFWIDKDSTPGRVSLSLLTILTMQTQLSSTLSQLPKVSYIKMIDVWLTGCLGFVFAGFLEYALVNKLATQERALRQKAPVALEPKLCEEEESRLMKVFDSQSNSYSGRENNFKSKKKEKMESSDKVDYVSRFLFPFSFIIFNVVLWTRYLTVDDRCSLASPY